MKVANIIVFSGYRRKSEDGGKNVEEHLDSS